MFDRKYLKNEMEKLDGALADQYRTLIDQYGDMISVTMETIDLDQDGAMDKVAVKYVGSDSVGEFITDYDDWDNVDHYIAKGMYFNLI